ncbi:TetR/AcrR family transcriptional regulator [Metallumcola ferriviriculae]|uniref:TetR/AcrR family transcriptional regulator n=1 Tax=Metallumcola ferriviriculae TaxID=3039180 RepID=A0AAU0UKG9_9FIRM|nr:TetR/AcrR family transcriptional regulator [Desulfitibacteraceae bacterium MK1]
MDGIARDKRSQILRAAARVFSTKGFHKAKVEEIAAEAEVGKGTVYEYFSSKKELFQEMFKSSSMFYLDVLERKLDNKDSVVEKLRQVVSLHLNFIEKHKDIARIILREHMDLGEHLTSWMIEKQEEKVAYIQKLIDEGIDRGELKVMDTAVVARMFLGAVAFSGHMLFFGQEADTEHLTEQVMETLLNGMAQG